MAENKKARSHEEPSALVRFIRTHVDPLSRAFVATPLARLTVRTAHGKVTLGKIAGPGFANAASGAPSEVRAAGDGAKTPARHVALVPNQNGEAGRTYVTVNAEMVGVFRDVAQPPAPGETLHGEQVLGYIEALRLRNEVRCPADSTLVAQVVVDGQPVDFGESLFVIDTTGTVLAPPPDEGAVHAAPAVQAAEPPRI